MSLEAPNHISTAQHPDAPQPTPALGSASASAGGPNSDPLLSADVESAQPRAASSAATAFRSQPSFVVASATAPVIQGAIYTSSSSVAYPLRRHISTASSAANAASIQPPPFAVTAPSSAPVFASSSTSTQTYQTPSSGSSASPLTPTTPSARPPVNSGPLTSPTSANAIDMATVTRINAMHHHFANPWDLQFAGGAQGFNYYVARSTRGTGISANQAIIQHELGGYGDPRQHPGSAPAGTANHAVNMRPHFRTKIVCVLNCKHCQSEVCRRAMKAILLADMNIELFSTDSPPFGVQLVNDDYETRNCYCRIRDVACLGCGNVIGYHVTQPCEPCMEACNNGHFWMFHVSEVQSRDRTSDHGTHALLWSQIPRADRDHQSTGPQISEVMR